MKNRRTYSKNKTFVITNGSHSYFQVCSKNLSCLKLCTKKRDEVYFNQKNMITCQTCCCTRENSWLDVGLPEVAARIDL